MSSIRKYSLTKEDLVRNGYFVEGDKVFKQRLFGLHNVIYAWYKGELPLGYDVDHIDNNPFNNNIDNLELVTHEENLKRRRIKGPNQWYYIKGYDDESWAKRQQELNNERNKRKIRKELIEYINKYMEEC